MDEEFKGARLRGFGGGGNDDCGERGGRTNSVVTNSFDCEYEASRSSTLVIRAMVSLDGGGGEGGISSVFKYSMSASGPPSWEDNRICRSSFPSYQPQQSKISVSVSRVAVSSEILTFCGKGKPTSSSSFKTDLTTQTFLRL